MQQKEMEMSVRIFQSKSNEEGEDTIDTSSLKVEVVVETQFDIRWQAFIARLARFTLWISMKLGMQTTLAKTFGQLQFAIDSFGSFLLFRGDNMTHHILSL